MGPMKGRLFKLHFPSAKNSGQDFFGWVGLRARTPLPPLQTKPAPTTACHRGVVAVSGPAGLVTRQPGIGQPSCVAQVRAQTAGLDGWGRPCPDLTHPFPRENNEFEGGALFTSPRTRLQGPPVNRRVPKGRWLGTPTPSWGCGAWSCRAGGGGWHKAMVLVPIGLSPLYIPTLCGSERGLVVSTEPLDDLFCLTTPGSAVPETGCCPCR